MLGVWVHSCSRQTALRRGRESSALPGGFGGLHPLGYKTKPSQIRGRDQAARLSTYSGFQAARLSNGVDEKDSLSSVR